MATPEQLQAKLVQAETAYHNLMTGKSVKVVVDQNGERVEFAASNSTKLLQYIQWLRRQLGASATGPLKVFF